MYLWWFWLYCHCCCPCCYAWTSQKICEWCWGQLPLGGWTILTVHDSDAIIFLFYFCAYTHTHTNPTLSCDRVDEEEVLWGDGGSCCGSKRMLRVPCAYMHVPEERQKWVFSLIVRDTPLSKAHCCGMVQRFFFFFKQRTGKRQKNCVFVWLTCTCINSLLKSYEIDYFMYTGNEIKKIVIRYVNKHKSKQNITNNHI